MSRSMGGPPYGGNVRWGNNSEWTSTSKDGRRDNQSQSNFSTRRDNNNPNNIYDDNKNKKNRWGTTKAKRRTTVQVYVPDYEEKKKAVDDKGLSASAHETTRRHHRSSTGQLLASPPEKQPRNKKPPRLQVWQGGRHLGGMSSKSVSSGQKVPGRKVPEYLSQVFVPDPVADDDDGDEEYDDADGDDDDDNNAMETATVATNTTEDVQQTPRWVTRKSISPTRTDAKRYDTAMDNNNPDLVFDGDFAAFSRLLNSKGQSPEGAFHCFWLLSKFARQYQEQAQQQQKELSFKGSRWISSTNDKMVEFKTDPMVTEAGLLALRDLVALNKEFRQGILKWGSVEVALSAMDYFEGNMSITKAGVEFLEGLCRNRRVRLSSLYAGIEAVVKKLVHVAMHCKREKEARALAIRALSNLSKQRAEVVTNKPTMVSRIHSILLEREIVDALFETIQEYPRERDVVVACASLLWRLNTVDVGLLSHCGNQSETAQLLFTEVPIKLIKRIISTAAELNSRELLEAICGLVATFSLNENFPAYEGPNAARLICESILQSQESANNERLARGAIQALCNLLSEGKRGFLITKVFPSILSDILGLMKQNLDEVLVLEQGCKSIYHAIGYETSMREMAVREGAIELIRGILANHADETDNKTGTFVLRGAALSALLELTECRLGAVQVKTIGFFTDLRAMSFIEPIEEYRDMLQNIVENVKNVRLPSVGSPHILWDHLEIFEKRIQEAKSPHDAAKAIRGIIGLGPAVAAHLAESNGTATIISAVAKFWDDTNVRAAGFALLAGLGIAKTALDIGNDQSDVEKGPKASACLIFLTDTFRAVKDEVKSAAQADETKSSPEATKNYNTGDNEEEEDNESNNNKRDKNDSKSPIDESRYDAFTMDSPSGRPFSDFYSEGGKFLGRGGFAVVRRYVHNETGLEFAVKEMNTSKLSSGKLAAVNNEIIMLTKIRRAPNIIRMYDAFISPETSHLVLEEMKGGDVLSRLIEKEVYAEREARALCTRLFDAVGYCHKRGIAHRDIKLQNLLLVEENDDSKIKLADFGLAKTVSSPSSLKTLCGTPSYAAPEIFQQRGYDFRCDMWSVGVVVYGLLGGYLPFQGNGKNLTDTICAGTFEFHDDFWSNISKPAKEMIENLLKTRPEERFTAQQALECKWMGISHGDGSHTDGQYSSSDFSTFPKDVFSNLVYMVGTSENFSKRLKEATTAKRAIKIINEFQEVWRADNTTVLGNEEHDALVATMIKFSDSIQVQMAGFALLAESSVLDFAEKVPADGDAQTNACLDFLKTILSDVDRGMSRQDEEPQPTVFQPQIGVSNMLENRQQTSAVRMPSNLSGAGAPPIRKLSEDGSEAETSLAGVILEPQSGELQSEEEDEGAPKNRFQKSEFAVALPSPSPSGVSSSSSIAPPGAVPSATLFERKDSPLPSAVKKASLARPRISKSGSLASLETAPPPIPGYDKQQQQAVPQSWQVQSDRLVIFQSAPLAFYDKLYKRLRPVPSLDFDHEVETVQEAVKDAETIYRKLHIDVEVATIDRFSAFFAKGTSRVMHISCHGDPENLCLENGLGGSHILKVNELQRFVSTAAQSLRLVVVSACHSLAAGQAFADAGVPHVICCKLDAKFRDAGATEFAKHFYRLLACGHTLKTAFNIARGALGVSPLIAEPSVEAEKFVLLPEKDDDDPYHDKKIFFDETETTPTVATDTATLTTARSSVAVAADVPYLPRVDKDFCGRELDIHRLLSVLERSDVVKVRGFTGVGRTSTIASACQYIWKRRSSMKFANVFWIKGDMESQSYVGAEEDSATLKLHSKVWTMFRDALGGGVASSSSSSAAGNLTSGSIRKVSVPSDVVRQLQGKTSLVVIDVRKFLDDRERLQSLGRFLSNFLDKVRAKVIIIGGTGGEVAEGVIVAGRKQETYELGPLDLATSLLIFGRYCIFVLDGSYDLCPTPQKFVEFVLNKDSSWQRQQLIYDRLGGGKPNIIRQRAIDMTIEKFRSFLRLVMRPEQTIGSRGDLEQKIGDLSSKKNGLLKAGDYLGAGKATETLQELTGLLNYYPSADDLDEQRIELENEKQEAIKCENYELAHRLQRQLDEINRRLDNEISKKKAQSSLVP